MPRFDTVISIDDADGEEHEIDVEIYYHFSKDDPSVGYRGGLEEYSFAKSAHKHYSVAILNKMLDDKSGTYPLCDQVENLINEDAMISADGYAD